MSLLIHLSTQIHGFVHSEEKFNPRISAVLVLFFTEGAVCPVTFASPISLVNIHITFYILVQKDAYVCRIILRQRVLRKETKIQ